MGDWIRSCNDQQLADFLTSLNIYYVKHYGGITYGPGKVMKLRELYLKYIQSEKQEDASDAKVG
jgi:hypothetical protein